MPEKIDKKELSKDLRYATKAELVKTLLTNRDLGTSWINPLHDTLSETQEKQKEHQKVINDYYKYNDWKNDSDYQKAMKIPSIKLNKYGLSGKDDSKELEIEQRRYNFKEEHPILSKFL